MTWEIVLGIIALFGFITAVMTPIVKLNTSITKLNAALEMLQASMNRIDSDNTENHRRLWAHNDKQDQETEELKEKITQIEHKIEIAERLHPELLK